MAKLIAIVGATGSGKDTLVKEAIDYTSAERVVSTTTRPKREGEEEGIIYNFIDNDQATKLLNKNAFIETRQYYTEFGTWLYGTRRESVDLNSDNIYIAIVDINGLDSIKRYMEGHQVVSIFIDVASKERIERALNREKEMTDTKVNEICRRNLDDYEFVVVPAKTKCDFVIKNNTLVDLGNAKGFIRRLVIAMGGNEYGIS